MVRPIILGAAASSNLLDGMKNQIRCGLKRIFNVFLDISLPNIIPTLVLHTSVAAPTNVQRRRTNGG